MSEVNKSSSSGSLDERSPPPLDGLASLTVVMLEHPPAQVGEPALGRQGFDLPGTLTCQPHQHAPSVKCPLRCCIPACKAGDQLIPSSKCPSLALLRLAAAWFSGHCSWRRETTVLGAEPLNEPFPSIKSAACILLSSAPIAAPVAHCRGWTARVPLQENFGEIAPSPNSIQPSPSLAALSLAVFGSRTPSKDLPGHVGPPSEGLQLLLACLLCPLPSYSTHKATPTSPCL